MSTLEEYRTVVRHCRSLFEKKTLDYGTAWRILRLPSVTDQLYIKAMRIRTIQQTGAQKIADDSLSEFVGIINYCAIALIQLRLAADTRYELPADEVLALYDQVTAEVEQLMSDKNHDYGEAWRMMRVPGITDIILMKLLRVKQIEQNEGRTLVSEGVAANYADMFNYAVFALILQNAFLPTKP